MQVLLISPLDPKVPTDLKLLVGGENTYTKMLIKNPPRGVTFIHFEDALKDGIVVYEKLQVFLVFLQKLRILPLGPRVQALRLNHQFDLVYAHAYPVKLSGVWAPLIFSDSSSNYVFLKNYLNL